MLVFAGVKKHPGLVLFALALAVRLVYLGDVADAPTAGTPVLDSSPPSPSSSCS
jgi:hypothetical protein